MTTTVISEQTSSKAMNAKIKLVRTAGTKYNNLVHDCAMTIIRHAFAYGDCTGASRLMDAMPKSARRALLVTWFQRYSPINVTVTKDGAKASYRLETSKQYNPFDIDGADNNPWHSLPEAEREPELFTLGAFNEEVEKFLVRMEHKAKGSKDQEAVTSKIIDFKKFLGRKPHVVVTEAAGGEAVAA